jgi:hypothetical protein
MAAGGEEEREGKIIAFSVLKRRATCLSKAARGGKACASRQGRRFRPARRLLHAKFTEFSPSLC